MKVNITDISIFDTLNPSNIEQYLISRQWREVKRIDDEASLWIKNGKRLLLPLDSELGDFAQTMNRVINTLAEVENRSQLELLEDFDTVTIGDVIRIKGLDILNRHATTLPFLEGFSLFKQAKGLILAGARAAIETKPLFDPNHPKKVSNYLKEIRLGQTERGSYVMKLISPLPFNKQSVIPNLTEHELPFERQAVQSLMKGLSTLQKVALETEKQGTFYFERFQEAVSEGVSANLCEAVIGEEDKAYKPLVVNVSWASQYPTTNHIPEEVLFSSEIMPYVAKAATLFRETTPQPVKLEGYASKLERSKQSEQGTITVYGRIDKQKYKVKIKLNESDYEIAVLAHKNRQKISCQGELIKEGHYQLHNPVNFKIL